MSKNGATPKSLVIPKVCPKGDMRYLAKAGFHGFLKSWSWKIMCLANILLMTVILWNNTDASFVLTKEDNLQISYKWPMYIFNDGYYYAYL